MSKTKIKSFKFEKELEGKLVKASLKNVEEVLCYPPIQLMTILSLSADEVDELISSLSKVCLPTVHNAYEMMTDISADCLPIGDPFLDGLLQGGLLVGMLTELAGPAGVGKTQLSMHMAAQCLLGKGSSTKRSVCFIDTESAFKPERILQILEQRESDEEKVIHMAKRIHVLQASSVESLSKILDSLEILCIENDIGLVIVDSIASLARKEFTTAGGFNRAAQLASWAAQLKDLTCTMGLVMIVTNQVTSKLHRSIEGECSTMCDDVSGFEDSCTIIPALGTTWTHFVNARLTLQYNDMDSRQIFITKSSVSPYSAKNFRITSSGIEFFGDGAYVYDECDPLKHKIKLQPGLSITA